MEEYQGVYRLKEKVEESGLEKMGPTAEVSVNLVVIFCRVSPQSDRASATFSIFVKIQN